MLSEVCLCKIRIDFARCCTLHGESVARAQGTAVRTVVAEVPACSMPSCTDMIGSLKLVEIPARRHLFRSSFLTHTARLVLLIIRKHALEMLLVAVVDVRMSWSRRASRSSFVAAEGQRLMVPCLPVS
jgi:hypothetical protein